MAAIKNFKQFIKEYRIISISVSFIIGLVAFNFVQSLVNDVILPVIRALFASQSLVWEDITLTLGTATIRLGSFLSATFSLLLVVLVLYLVVDKMLHWKPKK